MKKLISLILTLAMVLTMIPVSAFAATNEADSQSVSYHVERTNPLYEGANLEDASAPSGGTYSLRSLKTVTTVEAAGEILRQGMVDRQETVQFRYPTADLSEAVLDEIFLEAVKHTGVPDEGDYLSFVWLIWGCDE